jgi:hypothetical protein
MLLCTVERRSQAPLIASLRNSANPFELHHLLRTGVGPAAPCYATFHRIVINFNVGAYAYGKTSIGFVVKV